MTKDEFLEQTTPEERDALVKYFQILLDVKARQINEAEEARRKLKEAQGDLMLARLTEENLVFKPLKKESNDKT